MRVIYKNGDGVFSNGSSSSCSPMQQPLGARERQGRCCSGGSSRGTCSSCERMYFLNCRSSSSVMLSALAITGTCMCRALFLGYSDRDTCVCTCSHQTVFLSFFLSFSTKPGACAQCNQTPSEKAATHHWDQLSEICDELDVQGPEPVGRDEEQGHVDAAVVQLAAGVVALDLVLVSQIDGALLPDVLQDGLLGGLQCVVACAAEVLVSIHCKPGMYLLPV